MDPAADDRASRFETSNARFEAVLGWLNDWLNFC